MKRFILLNAMLFCFVWQLKAQWTEHETGGSGQLYCIETVGEDIVYTGGYSGFLNKSSDAGETWETIDVGEYGWIQDIHFFNENEGYLITSPSFIPDSGYVMFTNDGGESWTTKQNKFNYSSMFWVNENVGYIGAWEGNMVRTRDGGETWTTLSPPTTENIISIQFFDENTGYAISTENLLLKTTDGGETWTSYSHPSMYDFYFHNEMEGFYVDGYGRIGRTEDGGETFTYYETPYAGFKLMAVNFYNEDIGYVLGGLDCSGGSCYPSPVLLMTKDGGETWEDITHPLVLEDVCFYEVSITENGVPFLSGTAGWVMSNPIFAGVDEITQDLTVNIYPNPNNGNFTIEIPNNATTLNVFDMLGKRIASFPVQQGVGEYISLSDIAINSGIYMVELKDASGNQLTTSKIQIKR